MDGVDTLQLPASLMAIDAYAFKGWNGLTSLVLSKDIQAISDHVFYGCKEMTIYTDQTLADCDWSSKFNSGYRPVIWGCTLSEDKTYVVSVTITEDTISNKMSAGGIGAPEREGYTFDGWATQENGAIVYAAFDIDKAEVGTTLYAIWTKTVVDTDSTDNAEI
jgi:uncharacterized repeat protein (TIGR02543 family)